MAVNHDFEESLKKKVDKINELEISTKFITNKDELKSSLFSAALEIDTVRKHISSMKQNLNSMKQQNDSCKESIRYLRSLEGKIEYLENHIPSDLIQALSKVENETEEIRGNNVQNDSYSLSGKKLNQINGNTIDPTEYLAERIDCKKTLFIDGEDNSYTIEPLTKIEFAKIPKYIIGRQTLDTINDFIFAINKVMNAKYSLLSLGKNGARKKGELDLYLHFKKEEIDVCSGKERKYFFTAEDYHRETNSKLDKVKLNLLTALRHCKKIQELRSGKNVKYEVINTSS